MRALLTLILVASTGFAVYWAVAAQVIMRYGPGFLAEAHHVQARHGTVTGFPMAFRTELEDPEWQDAHGSLLWRTPRLEIQTPSYLPNRVRLNFPVSQMLEISGHSLRLETARQTITAVLRADLTLLEGQIEIAGLQSTPTVIMAGLEMLHATLVQNDAGQYAASLEVAELLLSDDLRQQIDPAQALPARIENISLDAGLTFTGPIALRDAAPSLQQLDLTSLRLDWGDLGLTLSGAVQRSDSGLFDGQLTLHSKTWQGLHKLLGASDLLERDAVMLAGMFLAAQADRETGEITLPLSVTQSTIALGPFVLGHLPGL